MNKTKQNKLKVIVILGPTSSGKSDTAIALAKKFNGEVISADSRQIYRDMNLGTGKVTGKWLKLKGKNTFFKAFLSEKVPHHLLDFRSPRGKYNISNFKKDCENKIKEISKRNRLPIICGGTGFWIDAITKGTIFPEVKPDLKLRKKLTLFSTEKLMRIIKKKDPLRAKTIDSKNKVRLIRAIEIIEELGKVPVIKNSPPSNINFLQIGIDWPQKELTEKIQKRLNNRWQAGMIKEIKYLKSTYNLSWKKIQSFGLGYFWIPLFLQNKISKEELREKVLIAERGYAKRQKTWFYKNKTIIWENNLPKIFTIVKDFLK